MAQELPGRIWDGKECMLQAIAAVSKAAPRQFSSQGSPSPDAIIDALVAALKRPKASFR